MTKEEKIIATAFTHIMFTTDFGALYEYMEKKVGHGVIDLMLADKEFWNELHEACMQDFIDMVSKPEPSLPSINGWVARDDSYLGDNLKLIVRQEDIDNTPVRVITDKENGSGFWGGRGYEVNIPNIFPNLKFEDEAIEVELLIKRV